MSVNLYNPMYVLSAQEISVSAFDPLAPSYDADFTHQPLGKILRARVHQRLLSHFSAGANILEIGCGTGQQGRVIIEKYTALKYTGIDISKIQIKDYSNPNAITVPISIVSENAEGEQYLYIADNVAKKGVIAKKVIIKTGQSQDGYVEIIEGIKKSDIVPLNKNTYRFYSQAMGEDEAGNLPSCYAWMAGLELTAPEMKFPTTLTIEAVDTRVKKSTHGNCGPNTMYNNNNYDYINYNTVLGVPIDTEGASLELFGQSQVNKNLGINYSTKFLNINDKNYSQHRLSSKRSLGTITSLGISFTKA